MGRFRLVRSRGEPTCVPDEHELSGLLFFCQCALGRELEARQTVLALRAKFEGEQYNPQRAEYLDPGECIELTRWVGFMIHADEIRFEKQRPVRTRVVAAQQQKPYTPPKPAAVEEEAKSKFTVQFVDEVGEGIGDLEVVFSQGGKPEQKTKTTSSGFAVFNSDGSFGSVRVASVSALRDLLDPRWLKARLPKPPTAPKFTQFILRDAVEHFALEAEQPHQVVILPTYGKLHAELLDKTSRVRYANCKYAITGINTFAGVTDDNGLLRHDDVLKGDHKLRLFVDKDTYDCDLVVLENDAEPQLRMLGAFPRTLMASVRGFVFEKSKAFVMPAAIESLQEVRSLFFENAPTEILVVGHADTTGEAKINDPISLDRANCAQAMLLGNVDAWLDMYSRGGAAKQVWGSHEDSLMIAAMPDYGTKPATEKPVWWYQRTRGLYVDGDCGKNTRTQLITEYMSFVGDPLAKDPDLRSQFTTHGCGENFPLDDTGAALDSNPEDAKEDVVDRRVEFFLFDVENGIQPPPTGPNSRAGSTEYPKWREGAEEQIDLEVPEAGATILRLRLHGADGRPVDQNTSGSGGDVPYRIITDSQIHPTRATQSGWTRDILPPGTAYQKVAVEWGAPDSQGRFPYQRDVMVECKQGTPRQRNHARLYNLGFRFDIASDDEYDLAVQAFQLCHDITGEAGLTAAKALPRKTQAKLSEIYSTCDASPATSEAGQLTEDDEYNHGDGLLGPIDTSTSGGAPNELGLTATDFAPNGTVATAFLAPPYGDNRSPALSFDDSPDGTVAYTVVMYDRTADWVHWLVLDHAQTSLPENVAASQVTLGKNSWNRADYTGPQPPDNIEHVYEIHVFALDSVGLIKSDATASFEAIELLLEGHISARGMLAGSFQRPITV